VRPYVDPYFASLRSWWTERTREEVLTLAGGFYPGRLVDGDVVAATDAALGHEGLPQPLTRILLEGKDGIERAMRARAADAAAV
jgi:aminopeptidase N